MLFDIVETKDLVKSNVGYLTPGTAPYYWIVIALEIVLFKAAHELKSEAWYLTFGCAAFVAIICVFFALKDLCDTDESTQRAQVRLARVVGVVVPLVSLALHMSRLKLDGQHLLLAVIATFVQVSVFLFLVVDRDLVKGKSLNIPQALVICSSVLFLTHSLLASLAARNYLLALPSELIIEFESPKKIDTAKWTINEYQIDRTARQILDDESPLLLGIYKLTAELVSFHGIHRAHIITSERQGKNLEQLLTLVVALWFVTLGRTTMHVRSLHEK
ncbi:UNVERIFIED_ORG: hypothetical protein LHJ69_03295 [Shinella sp. XGS7]|nr:hypothetical protein [Shinella sp. XGS7]